MTLEELITQFRLMADDTELPYQWSDEELELFFNEAEVEACRRAALIIDSTTDEVCNLTISSGTSVYDLDPRIIYVRRVKLASKRDPIKPVKFELMDEFCPGWEDRTGTVDRYVVGMDSRKLRLYREPTAADSAVITVVREPLQRMALNTESSPEIPERYHYALIHWVLYRAYSKKDAETNDKELASININEFVREFGTKELASAREEEWQARQSYQFNIGGF